MLREKRPDHMVRTFADSLMYNVGDTHIVLSITRKLTGTPKYFDKTTTALPISRSACVVRFSCMSIPDFLGPIGFWFSRHQLRSVFSIHFSRDRDQQLKKNYYRDQRIDRYIVELKSAPLAATPLELTQLVTSTKTRPCVDIVGLH